MTGQQLVEFFQQRGWTLGWQTQPGSGYGDGTGPGAGEGDGSGWGIPSFAVMSLRSYRLSLYPFHGRGGTPVWEVPITHPNHPTYVGQYPRTGGPMSMSASGAHRVDPTLEAIVENYRMILWVVTRDQRNENPRRVIMALNNHVLEIEEHVEEGGCELRFQSPAGTTTCWQASVATGN